MDTVLPEDGGGRPPEPIARLGKYTLIKALAKGGMAQVFLAQRDGASEICVLKQLLGEVAEHETAVRRFHREAKLAAYLSHPHIARVLDAGFEGGTFCIAMEYVLGKDLEAMSHHLVKQGRMLPYPVSLASIIDALDGLAYAHRATDPAGKALQLVHRDLSPRNVMLSVDGMAKVIDFGVARSDSGDFRTAPGMLVGTLRYVSPEQAVAEVVDARSDLYSLSVVLHELLTGHYLVPSGEPMKVLRHVVTESLPLAHELNPELPPELGRVIAKGLAKSREDRWSDAATYRQALIEAAGPLAHAEREHLGHFVRSFFQDELAVGEAVISFGKERFIREVASGSETQAKALSERTRTGYVAQTELSGDEPPHLGTVVPVELTSPGASTASMMRAEAGLAVPTNLVDRDRASMSPTRTAMFAEVEGKAMVDAAEASSTTPDLRTSADSIQSGERRAGGVPKVAMGLVAAMALVVLGAIVFAQLRGTSATVSPVQTSAVPAPTARPVAVPSNAPIIPPAPEGPAPVSSPEASPTKVAVKKAPKPTLASKGIVADAAVPAGSTKTSSHKLASVSAKISRLRVATTPEEETKLLEEIANALRDEASALPPAQRRTFGIRFGSALTGRDPDRLAAALDFLRSPGGS